MAILFGFSLLSVGYFVVENWINGETALATFNSTTVYRDSIFGAQFMWPLDGALIIYQMFISCTAIALFYLSINAQIVEAQRLNTDFQQLTANERLATVS